MICMSTMRFLLLKIQINIRGEITGLHSKNLFLKNKKNNFYLFSCEEFSKINLKTISKSLDLGQRIICKKRNIF